MSLAIYLFLKTSVWFLEIFFATDKKCTTYYFLLENLILTQISTWMIRWCSSAIALPTVELTCIENRFQGIDLFLSEIRWCGLTSHPQNWGIDVRLNSLTSVNHGLITFWCLVVFRSCLQTSENSIMNIRFIERTWTNIG